MDWTTGRSGSSSAARLCSPGAVARSYQAREGHTRGEWMARSLFLLALVTASIVTSIVTPSLAQQQSFPLPPFLTPRGTPEDQRACRPDAQRLCREVMGNDDAVLRCFQANYPK